jgi:prepilin-type processing-associated H-X9-DG protein
MYCPKCGASNPEYAKLCGRCGQVLPSAASQIPAESAARPRTSRLAIAALILGILTPFTCMVTTLPAIIVGIIALAKISGSRGTLKGLGMAITGIVLPIVVLPIAMGVLAPAVVRVRQLAFRVACGENLVGLGKAMYIYTEDNNGRFPTPATWCDLLVQHADVQPQTLRCPGTGEGSSSYAMNTFVRGLSSDLPPDMVLLFEASPGWNQVGGPELLAIERHQGDGCNVLFVDGHVEFVRSADLPRLRWTSDGPADAGQPLNSI